MVSVHRPIHSKIRLTFSLSTWQTNHCTPWRMVSKALLNTKVALSKTLLCTYCSKELPELAPTKTRLRVLLIAQLHAWAHQQSACTQLISLPSLYPLRHSRDKLFQTLSRFSVLQATESWVGPSNKASSQ